MHFQCSHDVKRVIGGHIERRDEIHADLSSETSLKHSIQECFVSKLSWAETERLLGRARTVLIKI